jgi:hypothetical protein
MHEIWDYLMRIWVEYNGRKRLAQPYAFTNYEIITPGIVFHTSYLFPVIYLNLHPTLYAVCVFPDGKMQKIYGGLNIPFHSGNYVVHYVDKTDRQSELLKITENTLDAARIVLAVNITYRISDPIKAFDIQKPVATLFSQIQADLKEYIRTRQYEDLIGNDDSQVIDSSLVAKYIKQQHNARHPMSKVFTIIDVIVQEKEGDPTFIEKRKSYKSQMVDGESKIKIQELNKKIASQEADMEQLRYQYKAILDKQKATADVQQNAIRQNISIQELEIQKMQDEWKQKQDIWRQKQEKWIRSMDAIDSAVKSPYLRDVEGVVSAIVNELRAQAGSDLLSDSADNEPDVKSDSPKNGGDKLDTLTDRLFSLLDRRKPKE